MLQPTLPNFQLTARELEVVKLLAIGCTYSQIAERLGMGHAIGPILQGLSKPVNDLSRGAKVEDIVTMIAVTVLEG